MLEEEIDFDLMCLGSEMLGTRNYKNELVCKKCNQVVPTFSNTYNLVPVHEIVYDHSAMGAEY